MDIFPEYEARGARPRRHIRPPARYADHEVEHLDYISQKYREGVEPTHQEGKAEMTSLTSAYDSSPPNRLQRRDAILQEMDLCYGAESQLHIQENQLAPQLLPDRVIRERLHEHSTPLSAGLHPRHPSEDYELELEDIRRERHLIQQTQQRMTSELVELRAMRSEMRQLVDAVRDQQGPSSFHTSKPGLKMEPQLSVGSEPDDEEGDDWPAPPPWPEPPTTKPPVGQPSGQHPTSGGAPATRSGNDTAHYSRPWFKPVQPPPQSPICPPAGPKYRRDYGGHSSELGYNPAPPQQPPCIPRIQPPPSRLPQGRRPLSSESSYHGPRPTIPNFSSRDPSEFARLKISLENLLPPDATELFKYQVLFDHLHLVEAKLIADAYLNSPTPFSDTMVALNDKFGQPHHIALKRIAAVMDAPDIRRGDLGAFERFALQIQSLVGMLRTLGPEGEVELQCGSHVARLLSKLPPEQRAEFRRCMFHQGTRTHTLTDLSEWLKYESWCQDSEGQLAVRGAKEMPVSRPEGRQGKRSTTVLHGLKDTVKKPEVPVPASTFKGNKGKPYCPYCNNEDHYLSQCIEVSKLTKDQLTEWIKSNKRCWRCARSHQAAQCNLKKTCNLCQGKHLQVLHQVNVRPPKEPAITPEVESYGTRTTTEVLYLDRPTEGSRVLLKVVKVCIQYGDRTLNTYAILDDGSERTMLLPDAAEKLKVQGAPEDLPLRTIRQDVQTLRGASVSFSISSPARPKTKFKITGAFTAARIGLADHTYPMEQLRRNYKHLVGLPIRTLTNVKPLLLIGSDYPHLITPIEPIRLGPPGGPAAVHTRLGWTLQGPASVVCHLARPPQCLLTTVAPQVSELMKHVERLWQVDVTPFRSEKLVTRSRQDQEAISILETKTTRVEVDGILRYATARNPADDVTRGKKLRELVEPNRWCQGPSFLLQSPDSWPEDPAANPTQDASELRKSAFCGITTVASSQPTSDLDQYNSWRELLEVTAQELHGASDSNDHPTAEDYRQAERLILQRAQRDSFPQEYSLLKAGKQVPRSSRLLTLSPELDESGELIRVGGRLRRAEDLELTALHPVILDPGHPATKFLIQDFDSRLCHSGPERVFAELRRSFWILRGREAVRRYQYSCADCRRWRARPAVPKMADLPAARLRLFKPAFYSTGMDCFGPFEVKVGRRLEKRWGIIFKCLTTRAVHLDLLSTIDTDAFLMALRRFIARRGTPAELFSDQGTNFKGGERELRETFNGISSALQQLLAPQKITFRFNPPAAPHFGGVWEREIRSVKSALYATVGAQPVSEEVLHTVLTEVEGILNSKPLGYVSSDASDPDPVTPNVLLMGRPDGSLPQVVYPENELIGRRRWKHSQVLADHFWARFIRLYVPSLQVRQKWQASPADIVKDCVVMIADPQLPRALWPIGRVVKTHPSPDGHVRSADVKVKERVYTRPVARLVVLPALPSGEDGGDSTPITPSQQ